MSTTSDNNSNGIRGRANWRYNTRRKKFRMRITSIYPDNHEVIDAALEKARREGNTDYDAVALTYICLHYLSS